MQTASPPASTGLLDLTGRTVLVTGAGQGVGREVALYCAAHGATVVVNDYHADRAASVAAEITDGGGAALPETCDVTVFDDVLAMVARVEDAVGGVDVLVNNAGNAGPVVDGTVPAPPFWETGPQEWDPWLGTNFFGVLHATRAALPGMVARGWGRVITTISDAGRVGEPNLAVYGGAKAGAAGFSRGLAKAVGRHGITVNCVSLGSIDTPGVAALNADPEVVRKSLGRYVIRRIGRPDDVAGMVLFLASGSASWITGQTYPVNGGYSFAV
ncbi:SDR family NAD(P)-dependent oxidoreductase [Pseudonocardia broussonetiae]|uniref:SDR family NAD(P)-dependent oxidoreductase n=1 Tax=Pseudonocardia broussonetiae TaxID=2736640 RepID=UPI001F03FE80|nr:SDR family oxidoreductase [Pseudonocardia broussonetiae]